MTDEHEDDDQQRWLRAARPDTQADAGWAASEPGLHTLRAIHDASKKRPRRRLSWTIGAPIGVAAVAATAVIVASLSAGPSSVQYPTTTPRAIGPVPAAVALTAYDNCAQMLAGLRKHTAAHVTAYGIGYPYPVFGREGVSYPSAAKGLPAVDNVAAPAHSGTNNQVTDVDEPDTVKTDGRRIITMSGGVLRTVDAATRKITATLDLSLYSGADSAQLLVSGNHALVLLGSYGYAPRPFYGGPYYPYFRGGLAGYVLVDLSSTPTVLATMQTKGSPVDARLVGSTVRFVVTSAPKFAFPVLSGKHTDAQRRAANRAVVLHAPLSAWAPSYTITGGHGSHTLTVPCADVRHPASYTGLSMTTVYTVDLASGFDDLAPTALAADGSTVYSTTRNLYIASTGTKRTTMVHRYDVSVAGRPTYLGSGTVPGSLLDSYSMSDYAGYLRVVTTSVGKHGNSASGLYELDDATLHIVGGYGGLGRHERVYAVRFLDVLAYVVTFRQVDPLYVLDLHNPRHPRPVGEVHATGYSSYLHRVGPGRLLGVGAQVGPYNEPTGLKLSLLDVSNSRRPRVLATVVRKNSWGGDIDPHAFLFWPAANLVVLPVQSWSGSQSSGALVVKIAGNRLRTLGFVRDPATIGSNDLISRTLVIGDTLWTMSDAGLAAHDLSTLARQAWVPFS